MKSWVSSSIKGAVSSLSAPSMDKLVPHSTHSSMNWPSRGILGSQKAHLPLGKSGLAVTNAYQNASRPQVHSGITVSINIRSHDCIVLESLTQWSGSMWSNVDGKGRKVIDASPDSLPDMEQGSYWLEATHFTCPKVSSHSMENVKHLHYWNGKTLWSSKTLPQSQVLWIIGTLHPEPC